MSSAVGPFAVDEGIVRPNGDTAVVRIFNTNTSKIIRSTFPLVDGRAAVDGTLEIPGVAGTGAPVRLDFLSPGGAVTGKLLPTGHPVDRLDVPGIGPIDVSMVDAANPCVFVRAQDIGLTGNELPDALDANATVRDRLQRVRRSAAIAMGIARDDAEAAASLGIPAIGFVAPPMDRTDPDRSNHRARPGRPDRPLHLQRPAAQSAAAHGLAVHRRRGQDRGHAAVPGTHPSAAGRGSPRHAVRHPHRGRRRIPLR